MVLYYLTNFSKHLGQVDFESLQMKQIIFSPNVKCMAPSTEPEECFTTFNDFWICLEESCSNIGCGRSKFKHSKLHYKNTNHPLVMKPTNLEIWCYICDKYVGTFDSSPVEKQQTLKIMKQFLSMPNIPRYFLLLKLSIDPLNGKQNLMINDNSNESFMERKLVINCC